MFRNTFVGISQLLNNKLKTEVNVKCDSCLTVQMNFLKRAVTSILRRPGKSVILLLLVFILGTVIMGAISAKGAIANTDANLRRRMLLIVSIDFDWVDFDAASADLATRPRLNSANIHSIGALDYVEFYDFMLRLQLRSSELELFSPNGMEFIGGTRVIRMEGEPMWFNLRGTSSTNMVQFDQDIMTLVQGNQFSESDMVASGDRSVAIVSQEFATTNDLSIGSVIELSYFALFPHEDGGWGWRGADTWADENIYAQLGMEFEIIGLFEIAENPDHNPALGPDWERVDRLNDIFVPNWTLEDIRRRIHNAEITVWDALDYEAPEWVQNRVIDDEYIPIQTLPMFIINDPANIESFREMAQDLLPEFHYFEVLTSTFDDIVSSMETIQGIADWVLWASIGATLLILSLLITLFLFDRRYEMGVYLALGEKKGKIISQILMEVVLTSLIGITLAVFAGHFISSTVSRSMLENELRAEQSDDVWVGGWPQSSVFDDIGIPRRDMSIDEMMEAFEVSLNANTILLFYGIGFGAVVLSTVVPVIYIVKLKPKKVLM